MTSNSSFKVSILSIIFTGNLANHDWLVNISKCKRDNIRKFCGHSPQESQKTYASKDKRFVHPSAASEKESDSSTYSIFNNINMCITEEPYTTRFA